MAPHNAQPPRSANLSYNGRLWVPDSFRKRLGLGLQSIRISGLRRPSRADMPFDLVFVVAACLIVLYLSSRLWRRLRAKTGRLPRGPLGLPFIGMLWHMPKNPVHKIIQLSRQYGSLYSLKMGGQLYMIIADAQIAEELLVKRAAATSSRESSYIASKSLWSGMGVIASPHNEIWRKHRRIIQQGLRSQGVDNTATVIQKPMLRLRDKLVAHSLDQNELQLVCAEYALDVALLTLLGPKHATVPLSLYRQILGMMNEMLGLMIPMANKEDFFTPLQLLPTSSYCRAREWRSKLLANMSSLLEHVELQDSSAAGSFGRTLLQMEEEGELSSFEKCSLAMVWLVASHASFPGFFSSFISSISLRSKVQQCARQEIDGNIEKHGLLQSNELDLPYCRATLLEAMRCNGPSVDSPHLVTEDIVLGEHFVPAGTALILDKWTINHDETRFENPMDFEPSRHLRGDYPAPRGVASSNFWIFGTGRRICPAVALSDRIAFLTIVGLLQTLEITRSTSKQDPSSYTIQCKLRDA